MKVSVTFELEQKAPVTEVLDVPCKTGAGAASRAIRAAQRSKSPIGWTSLVAVVERPRKAAKVAALEQE